MQTTIVIDRDGSTEAIVGPLSITYFDRPMKFRASHIVPKNSAKRALFMILRMVFGDSGRIATWTRGWSGPWEVRWKDNPYEVAFTHDNRLVCCNWEVKELEKRLTTE